MAKYKATFVRVFCCKTFVNSMGTYYGLLYSIKPTVVSTICTAAMYIIRLAETFGRCVPIFVAILCICVSGGFIYHMRSSVKYSSG